MKTMTDGDSWIVSPLQFRTGEYRTIATLFPARVLVSVSELLDEHLTYPLRLFSMLVGSLDGETLLVERCQWCIWTKDFVTTALRRGLSLDSPEFGMMLMTIQIPMKVDTVAIETPHASLRRILHMLSVQTDPLHAQDLSAHDVIWQFHKYAKLVSKLIGVPCH